MEFQPLIPHTICSYFIPSFGPDFYSTLHWLPWLSPVTTWSCLSSSRFPSSPICVSLLVHNFRRCKFWGTSLEPLQKISGHLSIRTACCRWLWPRHQSSQSTNGTDSTPDSQLFDSNRPRPVTTSHEYRHRATPFPLFPPHLTLRPRPLYLSFPSLSCRQLSHSPTGSAPSPSPATPSANDRIPATYQSSNESGDKS